MRLKKNVCLSVESAMRFNIYIPLNNCFMLPKDERGEIALNMWKTISVGGAEVGGGVQQ